MQVVAAARLGISTSGRVEDLKFGLKVQPKALLNGSLAWHRGGCFSPPNLLLISNEFY